MLQRWYHPSLLADASNHGNRQHIGMLGHVGKVPAQYGQCQREDSADKQPRPGLRLTYSSHWQA